MSAYEDMLPDHLRLAAAQYRPRAVPPLGPQEEDSLLTQVANKGLGGLHYVGSSLSKALGGRAIRGLLGGKPMEALSAIPFSDTLGITDEKNEVRGEDLLKQWGALEGDGEKGTFEARDLAGPALEMALDPATYLTFGTSRALTGAGQAAEKAGTLAPTMAGRIAAGQSGLVGVGLPFAKPSVVLGTGEGAQKFAAGLGKLGDAALYSKPGRVASRLFDPAVEGTSSAPAQRALRDSQAGKAAGQRAARENFLAAGNVLEQHGLLDRGDELRAVLEGTASPIHPGIAQAADMLRGDYAAMRSSANDLGRPVSELADEYAGYAARQQTPLAKPTKGFEPTQKRDFPVSTANQLHREDVLRDVPGGTAAVNAVAKDADLRALTGANAAPGAAADYLRSNYLGFDQATTQELANLRQASASLPAGAALPQAQAERLAQLEKLDAKAPGLAEWAAGLDPQFADKQLDFFGNHALTDYAGYGLKDARANAAAEAVHEMFARSASVGGASPDTVSALEALRDAGLTWKELDANGNVVRGGPAALLQRLQAAGHDVSDLSGVRIPRDVAADAARHGQVLQVPDALKPVIDLWDQATNLTKAWQTSLWPSFHTRNALTGLWQNFVGGVGGLKNYQDGSALRRGETIADAHLIPGLTHLTPEQATRQLAEEMFVTDSRASLRRGQAGDVVGRGSHDVPGSLDVHLPGREGQMGPLETLFSPRAAVAGQETSWNPLDVRGVGGRSEGGFAPHVYGGQVATAVDDVNRASAYVGFRRQGYAPEVAAAKAKALHYDYSDLTDFEKTVARRAVPFYNWTRQNLPFQLQELLQSPGGRNAAGVKLADSLRAEQGFVPEYVANGLAVPDGKEENGQQRFLTHFGLPFEDAFAPIQTGPHALQHTGQKLLGMTNPLIKGPLEVAAGKQFYSGRDLDDLYGLTGFTPVDQLIMNSPAARVATAARTLGDDRKSVLDKALYMAGPVKVQDVDMDKQRAVEARDIIEQALRHNPNVKHFNELYVRPEDVANLSPEELQLLRLYKTMEADRQKAGRVK